MTLPVLFLWLHLVPADAPTGTIAGTVRFTGTVPPAKQILTTDGTTLYHHDLVVDKKTKGLRYVAAILDAPAQPKVKDAPLVIVDQRGMVFVPRVVAVQYGQKVRFENNDLCNHSVMGMSTVEENQFNLFAGPNQPVDRIFALQKHPVRIECSLHPWMRAWVYVVPHPHFAISNEKGTFKIASIPAGKYSVRFHHADTGKNETRTIQIEAGKTATAEIEWK
jgi:plastocyanin